VTANQLVSPAMNKEIRAIAPGWLACIVSFGIAALAAGGAWRGLVIPVYFLGSIALGALSMGHEYSGGTLTLLLSQPRRRESLFLLKMGVLGLLLLTLSAVAWMASLNAPAAAGFPAILRAGGAPWQTFVIPLLCGLFIAPTLTMLCRNPLAGMVFTVATTGLVVLVGEVFTARNYGVAPTTASDAMALQDAILWWGMLGISAFAAIASWRLFMRLEAIDGRGQAVRLPWRRSRPATIEGTQVFAARHPLWLLTKKELRLQQLSFVVAGLYALGWFGIWFVLTGSADSQTDLLFALTAIVSVAIALLAGSLASAEERQLGTLEWHAVLPMSARTQWTVKAGTAVGVAMALGLGVPVLLSLLTRSGAIGREVQPLLTAGAGLGLVFLTVVSLYVSSLCASGVRALIGSIPVGLGVVVGFVSSRVSFFRLGFDPFFFFKYSWWQPGVFTLGTRLSLLLMLLIVLSLVLYAGSLGLLLRFARANHTSSERGPRRIANQLVRLGAFLALVMALWFGVSRIFLADMREHFRVVMQKTAGTVWIGAVDGANQPVRTYTVVVFREGREPGADQSFSFIVTEANSPAGKGPFETHLNPGRYSIVAVETLGQPARDPAWLGRLKTRATPLTIAAGDSKTLRLTITPAF
jgi:ABC-type transport system involved in multi-copper enzyme maturation permease subunit